MHYKIFRKTKNYRLIKSVSKSNAKTLNNIKKNHCRTFVDIKKTHFIQVGEHIDSLSIEEEILPLKHSLPKQTIFCEVEMRSIKKNLKIVTEKLMKNLKNNKL